MVEVSVFMMMVGLILVFVLPGHPKVVGIYLIVLSIVVFIGMGLFGILPFALFLPAGIVALRYKLQNHGKGGGHRTEDQVNDGIGNPIQ